MSFICYCVIITFLEKKDVALKRVLHMLPVMIATDLKDISFGINIRYLVRKDTIKRSFSGHDRSYSLYADIRP